MVLLGECCLLSFFFVFFYISIRAISKVGKGTQRNFQFLKSGLDDRDIVMAERSQK